MLRLAVVRIPLGHARGTAGNGHLHRIYGGAVVAEVRSLLVVGATSDIGRAIARKLAAEGWALRLAARDPVQLTREAQDLRVRSATAVSCHHCDVLEAEGGASLLDELDPLPDAAVCVVGDAGGQRESPPGGAAAERIMRTNYIGPALLMAALAERFAQRGSGRPGWR